MRGQNKDAWLQRWRRGSCPVHGLGLSEAALVGQVVIARADSGYVVVGCPGEECTVRAAQWKGRDPHHSRYGWIAGPDEIRALFAKAGEIDEAGPAPGRASHDVRTSWPLEDDDLGEGADAHHRRR